MPRWSVDYSGLVVFSLDVHFCPQRSPTQSREQTITPRPRPSLLLWLDLCPQCKDLCNNALVCNRAQSSFDVICVSNTQF